MTSAPVTRTQVRTVRVPVTDTRANALEEALAREVATWPNHEPIVRRIRSAAEQIHHGQKMQAAGRGRDESQAIGLGWSDPNPQG